MQFGFKYPFAIVARCREPLPYHLQRSLAFASDQQNRTHQHVERRDAQLIASTAVLIQSAFDLRERARRRIERCHADAANGARKPMPVPESVFLGQGEATLGMALRERRLAAQGVQNGCIVTSVS